VKLTSHFQLVLRSRKRGSVHPLPRNRGDACQGVIRRTTGAKKHAVGRGTAVQRGLEAGNGEIAIVRSRCQATSEVSAGWKRHSMCSSELASDSVIVICSYDL
jgi:hypothetical protein